MKVREASTRMLETEPGTTARQTARARWEAAKALVLEAERAFMAANPRPGKSTTPTTLSSSTVAVCAEATVAQLAAGAEVEILKRATPEGLKPMAQVKVITGKHGGKIGWVLVENLDEPAAKK